jgi:serine/threonine-protein kinase HipA
MGELAVYLNGEYSGLLTCDKQQHFSFQYAHEWIAREDARPLSLSLPLMEIVYTDEKARPFFTNLLPESFVREAVARKLGISPRNEFALLEALGGECAGAITLLPPGDRKAFRLHGTLCRTISSTFAGNAEKTITCRRRGHPIVPGRCSA